MKEDRWKRDPGEAWLAYEPTAQDPWDLAKVLRMHRRAGFGCTWGEAQRDVSDGHEATIARVLSGAATGPDGRAAAAIEGFSAAMLASYRASSTALDSTRTVWFYRLVFSAWPLRERMVLAWHNHYATSEQRVYERDDLIEQSNTQREMWRGPMSKLHLAMLRDRAMLRWLDGVSNRRGAGNENLGREFLELFSLGVGNYGETDVREAARALTGWQEVSERTPRLKYMAPLHDGGEKTILGQKGAWADEDLVRIVTAQPAAARRIAWRLWRTFISDVDEPSPELVEGLAAPMRVAGDVDVSRGLEVLLRSRLFHSDAYARRRVLSPIEWVITAVRAGQTFPPAPKLIELVAFSQRMGQRLYSPPNVAGWPGGLNWLNDPALVARQNFAAWLTSNDSGLPADHWNQLAQKYGATETDAEVDLWTGLFWGRVAEADERSRLREQLRTQSPTARAALVATLLNAPDSQLA